MKDNSPKLKCPQCGRKTLVVQQLPDGRSEMICVDPACDFGQIVVSHAPASMPASGQEAFHERVERMEESRLQQMRTSLERSVHTLSGRARSLAQRQLATVDAVLSRRDDQTAPTDALPADVAPIDSAGSQMPAHLDTPEVRNKRLNAVRAYHQRLRALKQAQHVSNDNESNAPTTLPIPAMAFDNDPRDRDATQTTDVWLTTLTRTLRQEAQMHERAARDYSRTPELFALQIDHSARAFELNRVLDLLRGCLNVK